MNRLSSKAYLAGSRARIEALSIPEPNSGCWLWLGSTKENGYGNFNLDGKFTQAHRASYRVFTGPIPDGLQVLHRCDNPACVNPDHLWPGTQSENMEDAKRKGRLKKIHKKVSIHKTSKAPVGVGWNAREKKWKAWIRNKHLGYFRTLDDALNARREAELA